MTTPAPVHVPMFFVRQKVTFLVNRYEIHAAGADGSEGPMLAFAQQKRLAFREQVTFYTDESRTRPVFSFRARQRLDVRAEHDVFDEHGRPLGWFKKQFTASLMRSTWDLAGPGYTARGQERRLWVAVLRRSGTSSPTSERSWCRSCSTSTSSTP